MTKPILLRGIDVAEFRKRQAAKPLAKEMHRAVRDAYPNSGPAIWGQDTDLARETFMSLALAFLNSREPTHHARDYRVTRYPPGLMGGKVLAMLEPNRRPS